MWFLLLHQTLQQILLCFLKSDFTFIIGFTYLYFTVCLSIVSLYFSDISFHVLHSDWTKRLEVHHLHSPCCSSARWQRGRLRTMCSLAPPRASGHMEEVAVPERLSAALHPLKDRRRKMRGICKRVAMVTDGFRICLIGK